MEILYEDRRCLVAVKPAGVPSQRGKDGERDVVSLLEEQRRRQQGGFGYLYLIHRLDREVGGLLLLGKDHAAAEFLASAMEGRQVRKEYLAILRGVPKQERGTLRDYLLRDAAEKKTVVAGSGRPGAKEAVLDYRTLETRETAEGPLTLVRILLHTGRTHQIRVQFASRGTPILGDARYGKAEGPGAAPALWAYRLTFPMVEGGGASTALRLPEGEPWTQFSRLPDAEQG